MQSFDPGILLIGINWGCNINFYIGILIWPWYIGIFISQRPEQARNVMSIENAVDKHQRSCAAAFRDGITLHTPGPVIMVLAGKIHHPNEMEVLVCFSVTCYHFHMRMQLARTILDGEPQKLGVRFDELRHPVFVKKIAVLRPRYGRKTLEIGTGGKKQWIPAVFPSNSVTNEGIVSVCWRGMWWIADDW